ERRAVVEFRRRPIVVQAEHRGVLRHLLDETIGQLENLAVDDAKPAVALRVRLKLRRQRGARLQFDDDLRLVIRSRVGRVRRSTRELAVDLVIPGVRIRAAGISLPGLTRMMTSGQSVRRSPDDEGGDDSSQGPFRAPDRLSPRGCGEAEQSHSVAQQSKTISTCAVLTITCVK